jgi:hypothetical protein
VTDKDGKKEKLCGHIPKALFTPRRPTTAKTLVVSFLFSVIMADEAAD